MIKEEKELEEEELEEEECECVARTRGDAGVCEGQDLTLPECLSHRKRDRSFICRWTTTANSTAAGTCRDMVDEYVRDSRTEYGDGYRRSTDEFDDDSPLETWWYDSFLPLFGVHM